MTTVCLPVFAHIAPHLYLDNKAEDVLRKETIAAAQLLMPAGGAKASATLLFNLRRDVQRLVRYHEPPKTKLLIRWLTGVCTYFVLPACMHMHAQLRMVPCETSSSSCLVSRSSG